MVTSFKQKETQCEDRLGNVEKGAGVWLVICPLRSFGT